MKVSILTFEGFNELDSFIALGILNRLRSKGLQVHITDPSSKITSMNGVTIETTQMLESASESDAVMFGSGIYTKEIAQDSSTLNRIKLDPNRQLIGAQVSSMKTFLRLTTILALFSTSALANPGYIEPKHPITKKLKNHPNKSQPISGDSIKPKPQPMVGGSEPGGLIAGGFIAQEIKSIHEAEKKQ